MNFTFEKLIEYYCPILYYHLVQIDMKTEYFTFKWCLTLFSCFLPQDVVIQVFNLFLIEGWDAIYKIGISLLKNLIGEQMMKMETMMDVS
jgi:hypothetical protein